ncbi:hypothetical protein LG71_19645 [Pluralibacter gergoviae]|uniref:hypothetical protein n=1 Tax=Pluralibacter gergoviae TaxID=61647 RepID=UPI0004F84120|nr:hypothetical protein [Pluralibacter gergoviae]AIR01970.1 hypothetical protein LG71_19645 [Pluralibacter gergoviae]
MKPTYEELEKTVAALRRRVIENDHNRAVIIDGYERFCTELKQQVAALVAENTALAEFIRLECYVAQIEPETFYESEVTRYVSADGYEPEKPATDAAIAEIRASVITAALCSR